MADQYENELPIVGDASGGHVRVVNAEGESRRMVLNTDKVPEGPSGSVLYHTAARVRAVLLDGLSTATSAAISASDSILAAFGKIQARLNELAEAENINYDNTASGLAATDAQAALDEVDAALDSVEDDYYNTGNILGTVSQSSGVPTGAIIERGSNANGEYVRYADGTLVCTVTKSVPSAAYNNGVPVNVSTSVNWDYPSNYVSTPSVSYSRQSGWVYTFASGFESIDTLRVSNWYIVNNGGDRTVSHTFRLTAIGRWY